MADDEGREGTEGAEGSQGGGESTWRDSIDEGLRDHPSLVDHADVNALAKSYIDTKAMVGSKGVILPKEGDDGDLARFRTEIGVPASPEEYDLGDFKPPEDLPWSETLQSGMLRKLHAIGVPNGQIREILDGYAEVAAAEHQSLRETASKGYEDGRAALREELGTAYAESMQQCETAFKQFAGDDFEELSQTVLPNGVRLGDYPPFVRTFINAGKQMGEHGLLGEGGSVGGRMLTPKAALDEIAKLEAHDAWTNHDHPEHASIQRQLEDLYKQAYPEDKPEVL